VDPDRVVFRVEKLDKISFSGVEHHNDGPHASPVDFIGNLPGGLHPVKLIKYRLPHWALLSIGWNSGDKSDNPIMVPDPREHDVAGFHIVLVMMMMI
jgi:hypothetical protein